MTVRQLMRLLDRFDGNRHVVFAPTRWHMKHYEAAPIVSTELSEIGGGGTEDYVWLIGEED